MRHTRTSPENLRNPCPLPELPPEIRFDPVGCPPEAIDEANALEGRTGDRAFEPVDVAIDQMRAESSPSLDRLESWALHPDERVVIALLTSDFAHPHTKEARHIVAYALPRAIEDAQKRGEIWTPVLDALSRSLWSIAHLADHLTENRYLESTIGPWLAKQTDTTVIRDLVQRTRSDTLICYIAEYAPVVDRALLDTALGVCPSAVLDFACNHHLSSELSETLLEWIIKIAAQINIDPAVDDDYLGVTYYYLGQRGVHLQPSHIQRLNDIFEDHFNRSDDSTRHICRRVLTLLNRHTCDTGDEESALRIFEMAAKLNDPGAALRVLFDPTMGLSRLTITPRVVRAALDHCGKFFQVLEAVAKDSEIRQNPEIRRILLDSRIPQILLHLAEDARPEEFLPIFNYVAPSYPDDAFEVLLQFREVARRTLSHTDLLPLLQASSPEVRLGALTFLAELQRDPKVREPTTQRRSP